MTRFHKRSLILSAIFLVGVRSHAQVGVNGSLETGPLPVVPICALFEDLKSWNGKRIAVRAELSGGDEGSWLVGNCSQRFVTGGLAWPTVLSFSTMSSSSAEGVNAGVSVDTKFLDSARSRIRDLRAGRRDVSVLATYTGVVRTHDSYRAECRAWGDWQSNGFGHLGGAAAEFLVTSVQDIDVVSPSVPRSSSRDDLPCVPPNFEELCRAADLYNAAGMGCAERVREILDIGWLDSDGRKSSEALSAAVRMGRESVVKLLLDRGAPADPRDQTYFFPITLANGNPNILRLLIRAGANVDRKDSNRATYLARVAWTSARETKAFLEAGANPNAQDADGVTALMKASAYGFAEAVRLLLQHGARVDLTDKNGRTALMYAASGLDRSRYVDAIPLLLAKRANISKRDKDDSTALDIALIAEHRFAAELLQAAQKQKR